MSRPSAPTWHGNAIGGWSRPLLSEFPAGIRAAVGVPVAGAGLRVGHDLLAAARDWSEAGVWPRLHELLLARSRSVGALDWSRGGGLLLVGAGVKGGPRPGPSPVDRARTGFKHHLITDGGGIPLAVTLAGAKTCSTGTASAPGPPATEPSQRSPPACPPRSSPTSSSSTSTPPAAGSPTHAETGPTTSPHEPPSTASHSRTNSARPAANADVRHVDGRDRAEVPAGIGEVLSRLNARGDRPPSVGRPTAWSPRSS